MQIIEEVHGMQEEAMRLRLAGKLIGFVPTMGFLHEGHLSLVDLARERCDMVVVSLFVNPTQFGPNEDFDRYPRDYERDKKLLEERGVDLLFMPPRESLFPAGYSTYIVEERISSSMEGVSRPQFFRGVCTVVTMLFNIVRPDVAVFGQKDAQQAAVIKKTTADLHFPIDIVVGPTVREEDGLAMSSRNAYLAPEQRRDATTIYKSLLRGKELIDGGTRNVDRVLAEITHTLSQVLRLRVIYVSCVDADTLEPLKEVVPGRTLLAVAVWCDEVRLIDNLVV